MRGNGEREREGGRGRGQEARGLARVGGRGRIEALLCICIYHANGGVGFGVVVDQQTDEGTKDLDGGKIM